MIRRARLASICCCLLLSGCASFSPTHVTSFAPLTGNVHGGQQPIAGAALQLYAAGTAGDGTAATPLLATPVFSNAGGEFTLSAYTCPTPTSMVYLVATGGAPSPGVTNNQIALMAAVGACDTLTSATFIQVNEITTVAGVYALAPFLTSAANLASSSTDASALIAAFATASQIANVNSGSTPGVNVPSGTTIPTRQVNTIADILAACINSPGGTISGTACGNLFALTTVVKGSAPVDPITALTNLAQNPTLNTAALYAMATPSAPFQPGDDSEPPNLAIVLATPQITLSPASGITFASTAVGASAAPQSALLSNPGATPVSISAITFAGVESAEFTQTNNCPATLVAGVSCTVSVTFSPAGPGSRGAVLTIANSSANSPVGTFVTGPATSSTAAAPLPTSGLTLIADIPFREGSGDTATDISGNGNSCTLQSSSRTPTWTNGGLQFAPGQGCDLPSSLNAAQTWCFAFQAFTLPPDSDIPGNNTGLLLSNAGDGRQGLNLLMTYAGTQSQTLYSDIYSPTILSGSASPSRPSYGYIQTSSNTTFTGTNRLCYVLGTPNVSLDRLFLNGVETPYAVQNASAGLQTSSFLSIGGANVPLWANSGSEQTLFHALAFSQALTPAQVAQTDSYLLADLNSRGAPMAPVLAHPTQQQLIFLGDSITVGYGLSNQNTVWREHLSFKGQSAYQPDLYAIAGITALALASAEPYRAAELCSTSAGPSLVLQWNGTNDVHNLIDGPEVAFQNIKNELQAITNAGCQSLLFTAISRMEPAGDGGSFESERDTLNTTIREQAKPSGALGVVDIAAVPYLGANGASANPSVPCFQADQQHPADLCEPYIAQTVSNAINYYFGSTAAAPTVYTSAATLLSSDRFADLTGCISTCNFVLPDGSGPTGEVYTLLTGSVPTTVQGITIYGYTQTVNGSSTPVTLPPDSTVRLLISPLPQASSGIAWIIR